MKSLKNSTVSLSSEPYAAASMMNWRDPKGTIVEVARVLVVSVTVGEWIVLVVTKVAVVVVVVDAVEVKITVGE